MRTLILSDLHLGIASGADVLRREPARTILAARLARGDADRLVLLGDTLELRQGPARDALAAARPVLRAIGEALPASAEILVLPGNHDHALLEGWWERRAHANPSPLGLSDRVPSREASLTAGELAEALGGHERVSFAYPGVWLRDDVYATHGHYLDMHGTVPTFERLGAGLMDRLLAARGDGVVSAPDDYEARLAPLYAWIHATAQRAAPGRAAGGQGGGVRVWQAIAGPGRRPIGHRALATAFPLAVAALNRVGLGPVRADLRGPELRRNSLRAMAEVERRLGLAAAHLVFGHSHRTGALPGDDPAEWRTPAGTELHNTGNWVFETHFMAGPDGASPYWPGGLVVVEDEHPPRLERLLSHVPAERLAPTPGRR